MRKICSLAVLLFACCLMNAQQKYKPGYVVLNSNDTLWGEIEDKYWTTNPSQINFKGKETTSYTVPDLKAFGITGNDQYVRYTVSYQQTADDLNEATDMFQGPEVKETVWLKLIYKSNISLYSLETVKRPYFFIEKGQNGIQELIYRVRLLNGQLQKDEQYKNLLSRIALEEDKTDEVQSKLTLTEYNEEDLVKVMKVLSKTVSSYTVAPQRKPELDVFGGFTYSAYNASGNAYYDGSSVYAINEGSFKSAAGFLGGLGITFFSKKKEGGAIARLGLNIASLSIDGSNNSGNGAYDKEAYNGNVLALGPEMALQWKLNKQGGTSFYLGPFAGFNIPVSSNLTSTFENPGIVIVRKKFPPVSGFMSLGLRFSLKGNWGVFNLQGFHYTNLFNAEGSRLGSNGVALTYGYIFKRKN